VEGRTSFTDEGNQVEDIDRAARGNTVLNVSWVSRNVLLLVVLERYTDECASVARSVVSVAACADSGGRSRSGGCGRGLSQYLSVIAKEG